MATDPLARRFLRLSLILLALAGGVITLAATGAVQSLDVALMTRLRGLTDPLPDWADAAMRGATFLGDGWPRSLIALGFIVLLMVRRYARAASYILYTALGIAALNAWALKPLLMRPRPDVVPRLIGVDASWSLPSGHAANSAAVYGAIALVATVLWWRRRQRRAIWAATFALVAMIGFSRVWLGVHWPSDVVAGWLVGAGWALLMAALVKPVKARAPEGVTPPR